MNTTFLLDTPWYTLDKIADYCAFSACCLIIVGTLSLIFCAYFYGER
jgi:hypothetical protein